MRSTPPRAAEPSGAGAWDSGDGEADRVDCVRIVPTTQRMFDGTCLKTWGVQADGCWIGRAHPIGPTSEDQALARRHATLFAASKGMAAALQEALAAFGTEFDADEEISGADLVQLVRAVAHPRGGRAGSGGFAVSAVMSVAEDHEQERVPVPCLWWAALWLVSLSWGGSEEGGEGWWFDAGELVTDPDFYARLGTTPVSFLTDDEAQAHAIRMAERLPDLNDGRRPKSSVLSTGTYEVHVLHAPVLPLSFPENPPRYE